MLYINSQRNLRVGFDEKSGILQRKRLKFKYSIQYMLSVRYDSKIVSERKYMQVATKNYLV